MLRKIKKKKKKNKIFKTRFFQGLEDWLSKSWDLLLTSSMLRLESVDMSDKSLRNFFKELSKNGDAKYSPHSAKLNI